MSARSEPLPAGWTTAALGDVVEILDRLRVPVNADERAGRQGSVPYYGATGQVGWIDKHIFDEELVLLGEDGAPFLDPARPKAYLIRGKAWVNNHAHVLRGKGVSNPFLMHQLNATDYHGAVTGTTRLKLPQAPMKKLPILVPPRLEQDRIVAEIEKQFTRLDAAIAALERLRAHLRRYRAAVLKAACEGKLVPTEADISRAEGRTYEPAAVLVRNALETRRLMSGADRRYVPPSAVPPDVSRSPVPEGWCWATVEQIAIVASGGTSKGVEDRARASGEYPWLKVGDMNRPGNEEVMDGSDSWLSAADVAALRMKVFPAGTIVFPKRGGAIATNKKRRLARASCVDLNCMALRPVPEVAAYLWWWFAGVDLASLGDGSNVPQINHGDIAPLPVPVPPAPEQHRIVRDVERRLSIANATDAAVMAALARAERLRASILRSAFEGRLVASEQGARAPAA